MFSEPVVLKEYLATFFSKRILGVFQKHRLTAPQCLTSDGVWFFSNPLANLQCYNTKENAQYGYYPEPGYNLTFMIAEFLIMMMDGTH